MSSTVGFTRGAPHGDGCLDWASNERAWDGAPNPAVKAGTGRAGPEGRRQSTGTLSWSTHVHGRPMTPDDLREGPSSLNLAHTRISNYLKGNPPYGAPLSWIVKWGKLHPGVSLWLEGNRRTLTLTLTRGPYEEHPFSPFGSHRLPLWGEDFSVPLQHGTARLSRMALSPSRPLARLHLTMSPKRAARCAYLYKAVAYAAVPRSALPPWSNPSRQRLWRRNRRNPNPL